MSGSFSGVSTTFETRLQSTAPTLKGNGAALAVGDVWISSVDLASWTWDGTYWIGQPQTLTGSGFASASRFYDIGSTAGNYAVKALRYQISSTFQTSSHDATNNFSSVCRIVLTDGTVATPSTLSTQTFSNTVRLVSQSFSSLYYGTGSNPKMAGFAPQVVKNASAPDTTFAHVLVYCSVFQ